MSPKSSDELWSSLGLHSPLMVDVLMPNGQVIAVAVVRESTLESIKRDVWAKAKSCILFRLLHESSANYIFKGVNFEGKQEEFYDEGRKICDLHLFVPLLSLIDRSGNVEEKLINSSISLAIGSCVQEFDCIKDQEFKDARRSFLTVTEDVVRTKRSFGENEKLKYHFPPFLEATHEIVGVTNTTQSESDDQTRSEHLYEDRVHDFTIFVPETKSPETSYKSFDIQLRLFYTPDETISYIRKFLASSNHGIQLPNEEMVLKVCGYLEYLMGNDHSLDDYQFVNRCLGQSKRCNLVLMPKSDLVREIPSETTFQLPSFMKQSSDTNVTYDQIQRSLIDNIETGTFTSLWKTDASLHVFVNVATYANVKDFDQVFVVLGLYHGTELLCEMKATKSATPQYPKWQEMIDFGIQLEDIPRGARLCVSMCSKSSLDQSDKLAQESTNEKREGSKRPPIPIGYGNIALFDYKEKLISGKVLLSLWRVPKDHNDLLFPLGVTGQNPDKDALSLDIQFDFGPTIIFPPDLHIAAYAEHLIQLSRTGRSTGHSSCTESRRCSLGTEEEKKRVIELSKKDPLFVLEQSDRDLFWKLRNFCHKSLPDSLPKLLDSVKWSDREEVAQLYLLLSNWPPMKIVTSLELLDCKYTDPKVRSLAVKNLDSCLQDHLLAEYLLQLVQVTLHEPYLDSDIARFLLKRALLNHNIGHRFFWMLKAEGHKFLNAQTCDLLLESFLRGIESPFLKSLIKQVEAVEKLTTITNILKDKKAADVKERISLLQNSLQQPDFKEVLNCVTSPLLPSSILGSLIIDECRIMDSAKRPLWLVWSNGDSTSKFSKRNKSGTHSLSSNLSPSSSLSSNLSANLSLSPTSLSPIPSHSTSTDEKISVIFKKGDDLRQDMLTLQVIKMMDSIWRSEGLDLKMSPYTCLSTGSSVGMIEVIKDARTVMNIQKGLSLLCGFQIGSKELHKWFEREGTTKYEILMDNFTRSCAGYCVATFVLGIGDRNPDNIMINDLGQIFHIDFGHFLGHFKKKFGINRERVPFVLTDDFLFVISRGKEPTSENLKKFHELCERAYLILRKHGNLLVTLFTLMLSTGIPELQSPVDIQFLREKLQLEAENESIAVQFFRQQLNDARAGSSYTKLDWFFHAVQHARNK